MLRVAVGNAGFVGRQHFDPDLALDGEVGKTADRLVCQIANVHGLLVGSSRPRKLHQIGEDLMDTLSLLNDGPQRSLPFRVGFEIE